MKVLLADPPAQGTKIDGSYANLGLLYLAGTLKKEFGRGELDVRYLGPKHDLKSHLDFVQDFRPDVYGISFTSKAARLSYNTLQAVKEMLPETLTVAGGAHPSALPGDIIDHSPVDVVVPGEGEATFTEVVKEISGQKVPDFSRVNGILFRRDGDVVQTSNRPVIEDLDTIPFPAWEMIDFRDYPGMHLKKQPIESSMLISRGCPHRCSFCSQPVWKYQTPWLRSRSAKNICEEVELLYSRGVREIYLTSDELNFHEDWAVDLCESIAQLNHPDLYFQCNLRADKVTPRLVEAMVRMKCWLVHLGIESANDRVLRGIGKKITVDQAENAVRLLSAGGIKVFAFMMLFQAWETDGELEWETPEEVDNSLQFVKRMFRRKYIHYMSWQFCTPMPKSPLYYIAHKHKLLSKDGQEVWETFDEHNTCMSLPGISRRAMQWKIKKGILVKDWFMLKSGGISWRHAWRVWENIRALLK